MKVYQRIAQIADAYQNCIKKGNEEWANRHEDALVDLASDYLPHGSGFDVGTRVDAGLSSTKKVVLLTSYHHMDENGFYCGWTDHRVTVRPNLAFGFDLKIGGPNHRDIKDYMYEVFQNALMEEWEKED